VAAVRAEGLFKVFGRRSAEAVRQLNDGASREDVSELGVTPAVIDASFDVKPGEIFVVMGLSGSGKSTLIRCINRIHEPTDGAVLVDGQDIVDVSRERMREIRRTKMAMVFQHFALFPHKTVLENAAYGLKVQGVEEQERRDRAMDALNLVGLGDWPHRYPHNLSGGMQQRVGLARALATDPDILLMDEAFSALDPLIRRQMQNELLTLQEQMQKTIVFITHDLNEALRVGTHVMIMKEGRAVQVGTPTQIVTQPGDQYVADFMADVDHAKVLPANYVMREVPTFKSDAPVSEAAAVLNGEPVGYVIDDDGRPVGIVTPNILNGAVGSVGGAAGHTFPIATTTTPLAALFRLSGDGTPVAVVDEHGMLAGMVSPLDILAKLGEVEVVDDPHAEVAR
jgi:glycine betaine/proline transport system ATP-binding protein